MRKRLPVGSSCLRRHFLGTAAGALLLPWDALATQAFTRLTVVAASPIGNRFAVVTFSQTYSPTVVVVDAGFGGCTLALDGSLLAVASAVSGGVILYDLSNPLAPVRLGAVNTTLSGAGAVALRGSLLAVGEAINSYAARICLVNVAVPLQPRIVGFAKTPLISTSSISDKGPDGSGAIASLAFLRDEVLVAAGQSDFVIVKADFSNETNPVVSTFAPNLGNPPVLDANSESNLIAAGDSGGGTVKIFDGSSNQLIGSTRTSLPSIDSLAISSGLVMAGSVHSAHAAKITLPGLAVSDFVALPQDAAGVIGVSGLFSVSGSRFSSHVTVADVSLAPLVVGSANLPFEDIASIAISVSTHVSVGPVVTFSPTALAFGDVALQTDKSLSVTLRNMGDSALSVTAIQIQGASEFRLSSASPVTVAAGAASTITVVFRPDTASAVSATLLLHTNDPRHSQVVVSLTGSGYLPPPSVVNGTFETGYLLQPWQIYASAPGFSAAVAQAAAHSGRYGLVESGASGLVYQDVSGLQYGGRYDITAWLKITGGAAATAYLSAHDTTGGNPVQSATFTASSAASWIQVSISFHADQTGKVRIHLGHQSGSGSCYWDDVFIWRSVFA